MSGHSIVLVNAGRRLFSFKDGLFLKAACECARGKCNEPAVGCWPEDTHNGKHRF